MNILAIYSKYFVHSTESQAGQALQRNIQKIIEESNIKSDFEFLRRGVVGSYKDELPEELGKKLDEWSIKFLKEANLTSEQVFGM